MSVFFLARPSCLLRSLLSRHKDMAVNRKKTFRDEPITAVFTLCDRAKTIRTKFQSRV